MNKTPLNKWHVNYKAKMVDFHGWEMPLNYSSMIREHKTVRVSAGIFDLCHMARIRLRGRERENFLQYLTTNDLSELEEGQVQYSLICNNQGGVIDDITIYKASEYYLIVSNASNREIVLAWLNQNKKGYSVEIEDSTFSLGMIAIQGPKSEEILQQLTEYNLSTIKFYRFALTQINGIKTIVSSTGYTGEKGFELYFGALYTQPLWERLVDVGQSYGLLPIGLAARDTLRIEASLPLYGNELDPFTTPIEARLDKYVKFNKPDFIGKPPLITSTNSEFSKRLICFEMVRRAIPRKGYKILKQGMNIGYVTSGCYSPTLDKGVGMGYVDQQNTKVGQTIQIEIKGEQVSAVVVERPFYKRK